MYFRYFAGRRASFSAGFTTHELMAKSGHKSLAAVERYTEAANKKKLADSGAAKMREAAAKAPNRITDQSANATYTNIEAQLHKHEPKPLEIKRRENDLALSRGIEPLLERVKSDPFDDHRETGSAPEEAFTSTSRRPVCSSADHIVESRPLNRLAKTPFEKPF
jgi:hypothetical protein